MWASDHIYLFYKSARDAAPRFLVQQHVRFIYQGEQYPKLITIRLISNPIHRLQLPNPVRITARLRGWARIRGFRLVRRRGGNSSAESSCCPPYRTSCRHCIEPSNATTFTLQPFVSDRDSSANKLYLHPPGVQQALFPDLRPSSPLPWSPRQPGSLFVST
jgi:hypothetical protein